MMPVVSCTPIPFYTPCDNYLPCFFCATRWLYVHLYMLVYMFMHESCLLVCHPCFNTMRLWTSDPNLHLSLVDTTFCLLLLFYPLLVVCYLDCLLLCSHPVCYAYHYYLACSCCALLLLSMHLHTLAYMFMHESCLLVCRLCFNTIKLWTFDPNLHLSLADTTICSFSCLFAFPLVCLLLYLPCRSCLFTLCLFICSLHLFLPLLVCWFLVSAFACTRMERGRLELGHSLPGASKKGAVASM